MCPNKLFHTHYCDACPAIIWVISLCKKWGWGKRKKLVGRWTLVSTIPAILGYWKSPFRRFQYQTLGLSDSQPPLPLSKYPFNSLIISVLSILMQDTEHLNSHINWKNVQRVFSNNLLSYAQKECKQEWKHVPSEQCSSQHHNLLLKQVFFLRLALGERLQSYRHRSYQSTVD